MAEGPQKVGSHTGWGFKHKHPSRSQQVGRQSWVDLHGEEESENWRWLETIRKGKPREIQDRNRKATPKFKLQIVDHDL